MTRGTVFPSESQWRRDPTTRVRFRQLTDGPGDSHHLYFTNPGWFDGGRRLLFVSTREGATNLFAMDLETGGFTQLTDDKTVTDTLQFACLNPVRPEAYFWRSGCLVALDLHSLDKRILYETPPGYANNLLSVTSDGASVCTGIYEDLQDRFKVDLLKGYVGFEEYWEAKPRSVILTIDTISGEAREVFSENAWIGHVNASPTVPYLATYCHEGPWDRVDNRIWGLDLRDGRNWQIRPRTRGESVGHEYWMQDGLTLGFHGRDTTGEAFFGTVRHDNAELREFPFPRTFMHLHSNDADRVVADGSRGDPMLYLWERKSGSQAEPVAILRHGCSASTQARHVHPRFSPDGGKILFVSDMTGTGNIYEVSLEDIDASRIMTTYGNLRWRFLEYAAKRRRNVLRFLRRFKN